MMSAPNSFRLWDTIIIGGGASGMFAAIHLKKIRPQSSVLVVERNSKLGKKILITGNGRCNLSNVAASIDYYHGLDPSFVDISLRKYSVSVIRDMFFQIDLHTMTDEFGRIYPITQNSGSVLDCLRYTLSDLGVDILCSTMASSVFFEKGSFIIHTDKGEPIRGRTVLVATGGACAPHTGSDGNGYDILTSLGHTCLSSMPGIVQIKTKREWVKQLSGIRLHAEASLFLDKDCIRKQFGELLFTDYGVSGPAPLQLSSHISRILSDENLDQSKRLYLHIDFLPGRSLSDICEELHNRKIKNANRTIDTILVGLVQNRLASALIKSAVELPLTEAISCLTDIHIGNLAERMKDSSIEVEGTMGLKEAQVTIGGALTSEFDPMTMMSIYLPGLFASGEVLDIDGDCGGYNLQWAFSSACIAADGINEYLSGKKNG